MSNPFSARPRGVLCLLLCGFVHQAAAQRDFAPSYSPDGTQIAFYSYRVAGDNGDIYVMKADGSDMQRLTTAPTYDIEPRWSPDGQQITYTSSETMQVLETRFVNLHGETDALKVAGGIDRWSSDGQRLALNRRTDNGFERWVYTFSDHTSEHTAIPPHEATFTVTSPDWKHVLFTRTAEDAKDLYLYDITTQITRRLTDGLHVASPAWSSDGTKIVFIHGAESAAEIYTIYANGNHLTQVTDNERPEWMPAWSPDGSRIAFSSVQDGAISIFEIRADGTHLKQLTHAHKP